MKDLEQAIVFWKLFLMKQANKVYELKEMIYRNICYNIDTNFILFIALFFHSLDTVLLYKEQLRL